MTQDQMQQVDQPIPIPMPAQSLPTQGIKKNLSTGSIVGKSNITPSPSRKETGTSALSLSDLEQKEVDYRFALLNRQREHQRYTDIDGMNKQDRIQALQDLSVNPWMLKNGRDSIANVMYRWRQMATSPEAAKLSPEQKQAAAQNYWSSTLAPIYMQRLGSSPIPLKVWMENAYGEALKWDINEMYDSHSIRSGLFEGFKDYENIGSFALTMLGGSLKTSFDVTKALFRTAYPSEGKGDLIDYLSSRIKNVKEKGVYGDAVEKGQSVPILGSTANALHRAASSDSFWHDISPNEGWKGNVTSWVAENAMLLPLYRATGGFNTGLIGGLTGKEGAVKLTQLLSKTQIGNTVTKLLLNGGEGAAYGYTMLDEEDKKDAWQFGVTQAILGTIFHSGGKSFKAKDVVSPEVAAKISEAEATAQAGKMGYKQGSVEDLEKEYKQSMSGVGAAGGKPAQLTVLNSAFNHLKNTEGFAPGDVNQIISKRMGEDKTRWKSSFIAASYIKALLRGKKLSELSEAELSELKHKLYTAMDEASAEAPARNAPMQEANGAQAAEKSAQTSGGKLSRQILKQQLSQTIKNEAELNQKVEETISKANAQAGAVAAAKQAKRPISEAMDVSSRRTQAVDAKLPNDLKGSKPRYGYQTKLFELQFDDPRDLAAYTVTQTTKNKAHDRFMSYLMNHFTSESDAIAHGRKVRDFIKPLARDGKPEDGPIRVPKQYKEPQASHKIQSAISFMKNPAWTSYAKDAVKAKGLKWNLEGVKQWLDADGGLPHENFIDDLYDHFYPQALKDLDLTFEGGHVANAGTEHPNFLAFMYNFRDRMPAEFGDRLSQELEDTNKFEKWLDPKADVGKQKQYYAEGMLAHMQELLASDRYKKPNILGEVGNVYRSTYETMRHPTEEQDALHTETIERETEIIKEMFKGKRAEMNAALSTYNGLAADRMKAYSEGKQTLRLQKQSDIDDLIIKLSQETDEPRVKLEF